MSAHAHHGPHRRSSYPTRSQTGPGRQARARGHRRGPRHRPHPARIRPPPRGNTRAPRRRPQLLRHRAILRHRPPPGDPRPPLARHPARHGPRKRATGACRAWPRPRHFPAPLPGGAPGGGPAAGSRADTAEAPPGPARTARIPHPGAASGRHPPPPDRPRDGRYLPRPRRLLPSVRRSFLDRAVLRDRLVYPDSAGTRRNRLPRARIATLLGA